LANLGKYFIFLLNMLRNREAFRVYPPLILDEMVSIGIGSVFIVSIVSFSIGAVTAIQTAANLVSPLVPKYTIGTIVRDMTVLELCTTFTCVILAGKVGSNIASNLGTMRITEQIDALEVMGINSTSYLVLPKIVASILMVPLLVILAATLSLAGGYIAGTLGGEVTEFEYVYGIRYGFKASNVAFALTKAVVFGFLIASISAYRGYYTTGGSLEVGQSSTRAVVNSCIAVLVADFALAKLLL
jgi:phospholipid/cholesterol/gamma-HCH transport system permease protein